MAFSHLSPWPWRVTHPTFDALEGAGARVRVRGLRRHQARLLRYLGVGAADGGVGVGAADDDLAGS